MKRFNNQDKWCRERACPFLSMHDEKRRNGHARSLRLVMVIFLVFLQPGFLYADLAWEEKVTIKRPTPEGKPPTIEYEYYKTFVKGSMMRMETTKAIMIYRFDKKLSWHIDPEKKTLIEIPFEKMRQMLYEIYDKMRVQIAKQTGQTKDALEQSMKDLFPSGQPEDRIGFDIKRFEQRETIKDMDCQVMQLSAEPNFSTIIWVADKARMPQDYYDFYYAMRETLEGLPKERSMTSVAEAVLRTKGFPMKAIVRDITPEGKHEALYEVEKIIRGTLDPTLFEKPEGLVELSGLESEEEIEEMVKEGIR